MKQVQIWVAGEFKLKIKFNSKYLTTYYFTYSWHNTFAAHVPNLIIIELLIYYHSSQQTLRMSSIWINAHKKMSDHEL